MKFIIIPNNNNTSKRAPVRRGSHRRHFNSVIKIRCIKYTQKKKHFRGHAHNNIKVIQLAAHTIF